MSDAKNLVTYPFPSEEYVPFAYNVKKIDEYVNSPDETTDQRLGVEVPTWTGLCANIRRAILNMGFTEVEYAAGNKIETLTQFIIAPDGNAYAILPTVDLPYTITGDWDTEKSNFKLVGDNSLRQQISSAAGASLVGTPNGKNLGDLFETSGTEILPWRRERAAFADNVFMMMNTRAVSVYEYADLVIGNSEDQTENDWAPAFQAAINRAEELGIGFVDAFGRFGLGSSVHIPVGVTVRGQNLNTVVVPLANGVFTRGFCFLLNISADGQSPVVPFPGNLMPGIQGIWFNNISKTPERRAILFSGTPVITDIKCRYMAKMVLSLGGGAYSDNMVISRMHSELIIGKEFQIELSGLSDGVDISVLHFPRRLDAIDHPENGNPNGVKIRNSLGFSLRNVIGGNHDFQLSNGAMYGSHLEMSIISMDSSQIAVRDTYICPHEDFAPIVCSNSGAVRSSIELNNVQFGRMYGLSVRSGPDVLIDSAVMMTVKNCYRRNLSVGNTSQGVLTGIIIAKRDGTLIPEFNNHSSVLSVDGAIYPPHMVRTPINYTSDGGNPQGIGSLFTQPPVGDNSMTGTFYYIAQAFYDVKRSLIRTAGIERSISANAQHIGINIGVGLGFPVTMRIYRGTASGAYTHTCDIPMVCGGALIDDGDSVNGYPWHERASGGVHQLNSVVPNEVRLSSPTGKAHIIADNTSIPNRGEWLRGDVCYTSQPTAGGRIGAVCVTSGSGGSAGVWKPWGAIDS